MTKISSVNLFIDILVSVILNLGCEVVVQCAELAHTELHLERDIWRE